MHPIKEDYKSNNIEPTTTDSPKEPENTSPPKADKSEPGNKSGDDPKPKHSGSNESNFPEGVPVVEGGGHLGGHKGGEGGTVVVEGSPYSPKETYNGGNGGNTGGANSGGGGGGGGGICGPKSANICKTQKPK